MVMRLLKIIILNSTLFFWCSLSASDYINTSLTEKTVKGIENAATSIISDSFAPMTHYSKGNWTARVSPAYFEVKEIYDMPEAKGDDLKGYSGSMGGGYAFTDELMFYGIFNYISMDGKIEGAFYGDSYDRTSSDFKYDSLHLTAGIGYDIIPGSRYFSLPVYAGMFVHHYSTDLTFPEFTNTSPSFTLKGSLSGEGMLYGFSGGIAVSFRLAEIVKITPYYLFTMTMNEADADAEVRGTVLTLPYSGKENITYGKIRASMIGLNIELYSEKNISLGLSVGGYLSSITPFIRDDLHNGLDIKSVVFVISYNGGGYR